MTAILRDSTVAVIVVVAIVHMCPRAIPLAMITMRKSIHGFPLVFYMGMGLRSAALLIVNETANLAVLTHSWHCNRH